MAELLESLRHLIEQLIQLLGYPGIFLIMLAENLFPPIPSEFVMPFAGFLAARGQLSLFWAIVAGTLGSVVGAIILYYVGLWAGEPVVRVFIRRYGRYWLLSEADLDRTIAFFEKRGEAVVLFARVIPIFRSVISLPAGTSRMPMGKFLLFTTIGAAIWTTVLAGAGVVLGENWDVILGLVRQYERLIIVAVVLAVAIFVTRRLMALRAGRAATPAGGP
jgi:membrane protein DedA with SNARE-associated domain